MEQDQQFIQPPTDDAIYDLAEVKVAPPAAPNPPAVATAPAAGPEPAPMPVIVMGRASESTSPEKSKSKKAESKSKAPGNSPAAALLARLPFGKKARSATPDDGPTPPPQPQTANGQAPTRRASSGGPKLRGRRNRRSLKRELPAWVVSLIVHLSVLSVLAVATVAPNLKPKPADINAANIDPKLSQEQADELLHTLAEPTDARSDQAVTALETSTPGEATGLGTGTGAPSATPAVAHRGVGQRNLPNVAVVPQLSPVATMMPKMPSRDLAGGGQIAGDVTAVTTNIGEALDQLAREILRHLAAHKLTVVWLFDESGSMRDDQQAIKEKFDRVASELKLNVDDNKKAANALTHAIVGYGAGIHFPQPKPTSDIDEIGKAIDKIPVDASGTENTCQAIQRVIAEYGKYISKERRLLIVLITDESGDDGSFIEEARQAAVSRSVPIYIIGRQSLFGYGTAHLLYVDPVTKDHYWPAIRRGPETAAIECLQWDGLHDRWDEQPSGFAPYELARLVKDTGGIYFLLPSEENMRVRQREKKYSMKTLKEYVPDYKSRMEYIKDRNASEFRRTLFAIIQQTKDYPFRRRFPVEPIPLAEAMIKEYPVVEQRLVQLFAIEKRLRSLKRQRDREPDKRWQAHYDLMLAQIVTYQIKAYEYRACLKEMVALAQKNQLVPKERPTPGKLVEWELNHSQDRKAPKSETEKKYAEAKALLTDVIKKHPNTPWADLAQDEINRGFGVQRHEWHHSPEYNERAKSVPKY